MRIQHYSRFLVNSIVLVTLVAAGRPGFARDNYETIDAQSFGTGTQLGATIGVTLNIYQFSTPADKQILVQAFQKGQNQGLTNALSKMKAVGHLEITGTLGDEITLQVCVVRACREGPVRGSVQRAGCAPGVDGGRPASTGGARITNPEGRVE